MRSTYPFSRRIIAIFDRSFRTLGNTLNVYTDFTRDVANLVTHIGKAGREEKIARRRLGAVGVVACALRARWPPFFLRSLPVTLLIENSSARRLHFGGRAGGFAARGVSGRGPREIDTVRTRANIAV